ncbi:MAG: selenocysteine-specific translation elongation factor [Solirubrobacterales bacterium]|nr:selenocysteine-specific translation elongation factor [Solirubrobacterales bacterium]
MTAAPLTLGTAGHIDHGKTALVRRLTGVDTDRLPEERARGISIALGYARLDLPSRRRLSVIDVPGHERFVRTMVSGATGIDLFLMVVAADDGVMPQTREHADVLRSLAVTHGVVAVTKSDLAVPARATAEAAALLPGTVAVACSARTGVGVDAVLAALDRVSASLPGRAGRAGEPVLHVDRVFTVRGAGTVVTGTLWSGAVARGDTLVVRPSGLRARVRAVHVHDEPVERALAGQRVALNLAGIAVADVSRGDVVTDPEHGPTPTHRVDAALRLAREPAARVHVHHGARDAPARLVPLGGDFWQARLEQPLLAAPGDRLVVRSLAPPDTLGGGVVLDAHPPRHAASATVRARLEALRAGASPRVPLARSPAERPDRGVAEHRDAEAGRGSVRCEAALSTAALALETRLRAAGHEPPRTEDFGDAAAELGALRAAGRAVRVGRSMYAHPDVLAEVRHRVEAIIDAEGAITMARLRDELGISRKYAQALLEQLDTARVTLRLPDDRRVLRRHGRARS